MAEGRWDQREQPKNDLGDGQESWDSQGAKLIVSAGDEVLAKDSMKQMSTHQVLRLPIIDESDHIIGILSQADLARNAGGTRGLVERRALAETVSAVSEPSHDS